MNMKRSTIGVVLGLVLTVAVDRAAAFETRYHGTFSGTFILTGADGINPGVRPQLG